MRVVGTVVHVVSGGVVVVVRRLARTLHTHTHKATQRNVSKILIDIANGEWYQMTRSSRVGARSGGGAVERRFIQRLVASGRRTTTTRLHTRVHVRDEGWRSGRAGGTYLGARRVLVVAALRHATTGCSGGGYCIAACCGCCSRLCCTLSFQCFTSARIGKKK